MTINHPVIADVGTWGNPAHASSVVNVLAGAGQATLPGCSIKRTLQLRYTAHRIRSRGICGCRAGADVAKAAPATKKSSRAVAGTTGVRTAAWSEGTGRVNWGPSAAGGLDPQPDGIIHKPPNGRQRRRCGHSKRRADRTTQPDGEPRATGLAVVVRNSRCRLVERPTTDKTPRMEIPTVTAYKRARIRPRRWPWRQAGLKPYWGKPAVRNFRGGRGNEVDGLVTVCHDARKGRYTGSHWPNHFRASALLDGSVWRGRFFLRWPRSRKTLAKAKRGTACCDRQKMKASAPGPRRPTAAPTLESKPATRRPVQTLWFAAFLLLLVGIAYSPVVR